MSERVDDVKPIFHPPCECARRNLLNTHQISILGHGHTERECHTHTHTEKDAEKGKGDVCYPMCGGFDFGATYNVANVAANRMTACS